MSSKTYLREVMDMLCRFLLTVVSYMQRESLYLMFPRVRTEDVTCDVQHHRHKQKTEDTPLDVFSTFLTTSQLRCFPSLSISLFLCDKISLFVSFACLFLPSQAWPFHTAKGRREDSSRDTTVNSQGGSVK